MDNELTFVLSTTELKNAGFEGSFNQFADEIAEMDCIVSGTYDEEGCPVITIVGIDEKELADKLVEFGVGTPEQFTTPVEPSSVGGNDLDTNQDGEDIIDLPDEEETQEDDPTEDETPDEEDEDEEIEIEEDEEEEIVDLHDQEEELHDQEEEIHDQEEEIAPDEEEIELHDEEEEIHDQEEERHEEIEDEFADDLDESKKKNFKGTKNISESLMTSILATVKDKFMTKRITSRMSVLESMKAEQEKNLNESSKPVTIYLNSWSNNKVNGVEIWKYRNIDIVDLLAEAKASYKTVYKKYKSLNESSSKRKDFVSVLRKQRALIEMLESEFRFRNINEDDLADAGSQDLESNDSQEEAQEMSLTSIVFKVKDADEFIKVLTDNGIPAEALKKGSEMADDDTAGSDGGDNANAQDQAAAPAPDAMNASPAAAPAPAGGANPFESVTTPLTKKNKLNEDGNPFDQLAAPESQGESNIGDPDQPGPTDGVDPLNTDEAADTGDGEEVILTDTSYASKVQKILEDIYGYAKADFEDKIGGEIVDEENDGSDGSVEDNNDNPFNDMDGSDGSDSAEDEEDDSKIGIQDSISPQDIFGDI